ncbi:hypothetical protein MUK42_15993 [Musa troglodytarum]|uniref:Uncharacterized protein n=1 Tax=Musa troglodytarum TaxID=320322 RepID=A0A9E7K063_9LILI|nr:hypothetical protein MUK42_15993 [Musa troglodytarum]
MLECTHHLVVFNANSRGAYESLAGARVVRLRDHPRQVPYGGRRHARAEAAARRFLGARLVERREHHRQQKPAPAPLPELLRPRPCRSPVRLLLAAPGRRQGCLCGPPADPRPARRSGGVGADPRGFPVHGQEQLRGLLPVGRPLAGERRGGCPTPVLVQHLGPVFVGRRNPRKRCRRLLVHGCRTLLLPGRRRNRALLRTVVHLHRLMVQQHVFYVTEEKRTPLL